MSYVECDNAQEETKCPDAVDIVLLPRTGDIGGFEVKRALPSKKRRMVGPFVFWDQMGPGDFDPGKGLDVRPHPHIGLSTVTWLFEGTMGHKDSLGNDLVIKPGQVNLMTAGRGIVHSERSDDASRADQSTLFGLQIWLALPKDKAEIEPTFDHYGSQQVPVFKADGVTGSVIMGEAFATQSPVKTHWPTLYVDMYVAAGAKIPVETKYQERALYIVKGEIKIDDTTFGETQLVILKPGAEVSFTTSQEAHVMLMGGDTLDGPRYLWWNFVSHSKERIIEAAEAWQRREFPEVPGDEEEFIPLPDISTLKNMKL